MTDFEEQPYSLQQQIALLQSQLLRLRDYQSFVADLSDRILQGDNEETLARLVVAELSSLLEIIYCNIVSYGRCEPQPDDSTLHISEVLLFSEQKPSQMQQTPYLDPTTQPTVLLSPQDYPQLYAQLLQPSIVTCCIELPYSVGGLSAGEWVNVLVCPFQAILPGHSFRSSTDLAKPPLMGDILLVKAAEDCFCSLEIALVEQVAKLCAIAFRQAYSVFQMNKPQ